MFLQYQWQPKGENKKTFLELPSAGSKVKAIRYGKFICKAVPGVFTETLSTGIKYVNAEGIAHPFVRNAWFKASDFAKPTIVEGGEDVDMGSTSGGDTNW